MFFVDCLDDLVCYDERIILFVIYNLIGYKECFIWEFVND